jgi:hypothetical protein
MDAEKRQRRYGDDVPWDQGDATVEELLRAKATELGITLEEARKGANRARGGSRDENRYTFDQAYMALEMGLIQSPLIKLTGAGLRCI